MYLKYILSAKWRLFHLGLNVLTHLGLINGIKGTGSSNGSLHDGTKPSPTGKKKMPSDIELPSFVPLENISVKFYMRLKTSFLRKCVLTHFALGKWL